MQSVILFLLISISVFIGFSDATCSITKIDESNSLKCDHTSINEIAEKGHEKVSNIFITLSKIPNIGSYTFSSFGSVVRSLSLHNSEIVEVDPQAFSGLNNVKKLNLNGNNISTVHWQWFDAMPDLQELDLSFNKIKKLDASVFKYLLNLKNLNVNNNQIVCLRSSELESMSGLEKIRIDGNPFEFLCRGRLTQWLKDKGIRYASEGEGFKYREDFLDSLIWRCTIDQQIANSELLTKECVFLNLYNQLQTALVTSCSFPSSAAECVNERSSLVRCIQQSGEGNVNNGEAVRKLLLALRRGSRTLR